MNSKISRMRSSSIAVTRDLAEADMAMPQFITLWARPAAAPFIQFLHGND